MFTTPEDHFLQEAKADTLYSTQKGLHLGNKRAQDALLGAKASSYCKIAQACTLATDRGLRKRCTLSITSSFDDSHSGSVSKRPCMARAAVRDAGLHQHSTKLLRCMNRVEQGHYLLNSSWADLQLSARPAAVVLGTCNKAQGATCSAAECYALPNASAAHRCKQHQISWHPP